MSQYRLNSKKYESPRVIIQKMVRYEVSGNSDMTGFLKSLIVQVSSGFGHQLGLFILIPVCHENEIYS